MGQQNHYKFASFVWQLMNTTLHFQAMTYQGKYCMTSAAKKIEIGVANMSVFYKQKQNYMAWLALKKIVKMKKNTKQHNQLQVSFWTK